MKNKVTLKNVVKEKTGLNSVNLETGNSRSQKIVYVVLVFALLLAALTAGAFLGPKIVPSSTAYQSDIWANNGVTEIKPGPWGKVGLLPITILAPEELLNPLEIEKKPVQWIFQGYTLTSFIKLLEDLDLPKNTLDKILDPGPMKIFSNGLMITPSREVVLGLDHRSLEAMYMVLSKSQQNQQSEWVIWQKDFDEYPKLGVSQEAISLFKRMSVRSGNFWVCYSMPYVLQGINRYEDKVVFLKALSQQSTMLVKLHVYPNSDVTALTKYWGKAFWKNNVSAILDAMKRSPHGGNLDVIELLPPFPTSMLYNYPIPQNGLSGPIISQNCSWTALNFFRDVPDSGFSRPVYTLAKLKTEYFPIQSDPQFGDVILFLSPQGSVVHAATFIADNIAYSKNGTNNLHPWVFSKITDLTESFSFGLTGDQKLSVLYFRNKYY